MIRSFPLPKAETAPNGNANTGLPRLKAAAHEFEAAMMKELLAGLTPGHDSLDGDEGSAGGSSALGGFASEALGRAISNAGGFGIADSILKKLSAHSGDLSTISVHRS